MHIKLLVIFVVTKGGKKIHAHSAILGCRCPRMKEVNRQDVCVPVGGHYNVIQTSL